MSKLIKALSVGTLILPIILCIIAMCHKFDYGRIVIDTVLLLTAIVIHIHIQLLSSDSSNFTISSFFSGSIYSGNAISNLI